MVYLLGCYHPSLVWGVFHRIRPEDLAAKCCHPVLVWGAVHLLQAVDLGLAVVIPY